MSSPADGSSADTKSGSNAARGLRHFSMMVCQKVEEKGTTTYNEVADELVLGVIKERGSNEKPKSKYDEKNIRRRVYDALNVLMAMEIISKEKKDITWKGLPKPAKLDMDAIKSEVELRDLRLREKRDALKDMLVQQVCFRNLVQRNQRNEAGLGKVPDEKIPLPFVVVNTNQSAVIKCDMSGDRTNVMFNFSLPFEINDDNTILKNLQLDRTSMLSLKQMFPTDLLEYCKSHRLVDDVLGQGSAEIFQPDNLLLEQAIHPHKESLQKESLSPVTSIGPLTN